MAKVVGPLMSLEASGSVASTLTFSRWKGRPYVRQTVTPANPKSAAQTSFRAMFRFLSQIWQTMSPTDQGSWETAGKTLNASPFNGFMRANQRLWTQAETPSANSVIAHNDTDDISGVTATGGVREIDLQITEPNVLGGCWGCIIYRSTTTGFTPTQNDVVGVVPLANGATIHFVDTGLTPDTYYYRVAPFSDSGNLGDLFTEVNATAT